MNRILRSLAVASACTLLFAAGAARAADADRAPVLEPLPEIPPPPDLDNVDLAPQVTITQKDRETI